ncbi:MAG: hypothetical protein PHI85_05760 [Victivallaceae bacterium]|nr:hypothetical protein [Victivallaceae bacterium]
MYKTPKIRHFSQAVLTGLTRGATDAFIHNPMAYEDRFDRKYRKLQALLEMNLKTGFSRLNPIYSVFDGMESHCYMMRPQDAPPNAI